MQVDDGLPMKTLVAALKGHFDRNKTVEEVFAEMDQDESGYLDIEVSLHLECLVSFRHGVMLRFEFSLRDTVVLCAIGGACGYRDAWLRG